MKSKIILGLIIVLIGGAAFLTLNKKTEAPTTNNETGLESNQTNTYKNSYDTDNDRENENKADEDNSTTQNPVVQKPTTQTPTKNT